MAMQLTRDRRRGALAGLAAVVAVDVAGLAWTAQAGEAVSPAPRAAPQQQPTFVPMVAAAPEVRHRIVASPPVTGTPTLAPDSVAIPVQHVVAPVDVCPIVAGALEPPIDVSRTCRWAGGAELTATAGTSVVAGHINWAGVTGALGNIDQLHPGDAVYTAGADGTITPWRVATVAHRPKTDGIDTKAFVGKDGPRQLYLITCGGAFDASSGNYLDNIYVRAVPQDQPSTSSSVTAL